MEDQIHIFVDESGDTSLKEYSEGSKDFYVISALLLSEEKLDFFTDAADEIVKKHAGKGELKSSSIRSNYKRRERILKDIIEAGFTYYSLVVDKTSIWKDSGMRFRPSFYKFLHKMVYSRIHKPYHKLEVIVDNHGKTEFMVGFIDYIGKRIDLFDSINFEQSSAVPLLQIADVIAGTIRRVFMEKDSSELLEIIGYSSMPTEKWPPSAVSHSDISFDDHNENLNKLVRKIAVSSAKDFVEKNLTSGSENLNIQAECVRFLLYKYYEDPKSFIFRDEITIYLNNRLGCNLTTHLLSSTILGPIKDSGVIISSTDKGIKIPYDTHDIKEWVKRVDSQVVPYANRLRNVQNQFLIASGKEYNIINENEFPELTKYLSSLSSI